MKKQVRDIDRSKLNFIQKSNIRHSNKYDYSNVNYINSITKTEIICPKHGSFWVRPDAHVRKVGCPNCNGGIKYTHEEFLEKCYLLYGNSFDYSKINYINSLTNIEVICPIHGSFFIKPSSFLDNHNCQDCNNPNKRKTIEKFIIESNFIHNNKYDYSKSIYINNRIKLIIICPTHGEFIQTPKDHLNNHGCPSCNDSKGEKMLSNFFTKNKIYYKKQFTFNDCLGLGGRKLPFDFYLIEYNILVEFDGRQHFEIVEAFGGLNNFLKLKENDEIKNNYCLMNKIKLIRIRYNNIELDMNKLVEVLCQTQ
jgi:very-short-patch-repair endonuclease